MNARTKEAIRYLGYGNHAVDDQTLSLIQEVFTELDQIAEKRIVYRIFDIVHVSEARIKIEQMEIESRSLGRNLKGCKKVLMLGATLGVGVDLLMKRYSCTQIAKAVVMQACAAAVLEEYLNEWQEKKKEELHSEGWYLRPRFSPGYGDFPLKHQKDMLGMLEAAKKIGLTMTDSSMLSPTKSVTAVIGLTRKEEHCHRNGCEECAKIDCIYRR